MADTSEDTPQHQKRLARLMPAFMYWVGFLVLNFLLFLPLYLLNYQDATFLPRIASLHEWLVSRSNPDIFRLNLEISLLILAFPWLRRLWAPVARRWYARVFFLIYLLAFIYAIYESAITSLYHVNPNIFNDYRFIISGIGFLIDGLRLSGWYLLAIALGTLLVLALLYKLILLWFTRLPVDRLGPITRYMALAGIIMLLGINISSRQAMAQPERVVTSLSAKITANIQASLNAREELKSYNAIRPEESYDYTTTTRLFRRPNIYLIFVESYGSVLYKRPHFVDAYKALMQQTEARLQEGGWTMETGLSTSPTWGGGSWMAYTSAEFGLHISSQPQFLAIEEHYIQKPYPSLGRYLQSQGYWHVRLAPIERKLGYDQQVANNALYGPDQWIFPQDLDYHGPLYGWGPSPPDQFSLNKAREMLKEENKHPLFFFYLTQGSHYPWAPLPPYLDDWHDLNNPNWPSPPPLNEPIPHRDNIKHYRSAIAYQWQNLGDFILSTPQDEDAIFILIGDHQPPRVSRKEDGYETPIHIITRDPAFAQQFERYGFEPGMLVSDLEADMKHEGFYSMFVRELVHAYGSSTVPLPYLPDGIRLDIPTPTPTPSPSS